MGAYLDMLRENPDEIIALYKDLLIGVTGFFRDPEAFQVLEQRVIPELISRKGARPRCGSGYRAAPAAKKSIRSPCS